MAYTSAEIISGVEKKFPLHQQIILKNGSDLRIGFQETYLNQFIIGLTPRDQFGYGIDHYEAFMRRELKEVTPRFKCLPWSFHDYETEEIRKVLQELSDYYQADLDIERMIKQTIKRDNGDMYYVVITVIQYPIVHVE
jgi:hypothetical protein